MPGPGSHNLPGGIASVRALASVDELISQPQRVSVSCCIPARTRRRSVGVALFLARTSVESKVGLLRILSVIARG